jgi:hypothetical protein
LTSSCISETTEFKCKHESCPSWPMSTPHEEGELRILRGKQTQTEVALKSHFLKISLKSHFLKIALKSLFLKIPLPQNRTFANRSFPNIDVQNCRLLDYKLLFRMVLCVFHSTTLSWCKNLPAVRIVVYRLRVVRFLIALRLQTVTLRFYVFWPSLEPFVINFCCYGDYKFVDYNFCNFWTKSRNTN